MNMVGMVKNKDWVRQSFLVEDKDLTEISKLYRNFHTALVKFVDGTPGGNICINPLPQPSIYADPPPNGSFSLRVGSQGLGSFYSEAFDDNKQVIHMRFGVPAYNSLTTWFGGFYNTKAGKLARTGRADEAFYYLGKVVGYVVSLVAWPLLAASLIYKMGRYFMGKPSSKFYYLKPTMALYWSAVQNIVNHIAVNSGLTLANQGKDANGNPTQPELAEKYDRSDFPGAEHKLHEAFPDVVTENGYIDVFNIACKAQRLVNYQDRLLEALEQKSAFGNMNDLKVRLKNLYTKKLNLNSTGSNGDFNEYIKKWLSSTAGQPSAEETDQLTSANDPTYSGKSVTNTSFFDFLNSEFNDGGAFASFRVNYTGAVSESFSNDFSPSEYGEKINSMVSEARSKLIDLAGGNIVGGPIGDVVGKVISGAKDIIAGAADALSVQGLAILGGAAFADLPKHWSSSSASLPRSSYTMELISYSGDPMSQLVRIYIPLAMILAGALPLATGKQSHTSPFICEYYDRGRCQTRLGMISSISIERGGLGNVGFSKAGRALSIRVTFEIEDMSSIMAMPITEGFNIKESLAAMLGNSMGINEEAVSAITSISSSFDDDTFFSDYMSILGGASLRSQIYRFAKLRRRLALNTYKQQQLTSKAYWAHTLVDTSIGQGISMFFHGSAKLE
jgi:hypothetical protein